ncbi:tetratricopeptide repeat protein [Nocardiopsis suaedae]|uniref:Tetratricopeptide repeat protein n=1 Tax=Nocardiopsis suaedae TaxID=3018444 RepID=A0ABT4THY1_9ACTN|nr:hypothetical protein [Nocardiopsis suaedae]MDA2804299.1 hypothetical protein [Nocardiopsis suaedae]
MTATTGSSSPSDAAGDESAFADLCDQARDLAHNGHFARAAQLYEKVLEGGSREHRAAAALGLAVARHSAGQVSEAREAARAAMETGHPEYAPRAAYHLALSCEEEGLLADAERAWTAVLDSGHEGYAPAAHHGLARAAEERGDADVARGHWERALAGGSDSVPDAAQDYAERLLARGETERAEAAVRRGLEAGEHPGLRMLLGAVHVERAIEQFGIVVDTAAPRGRAVGDPSLPAADVPAPAAATAYELLARLLAVRGDQESAAQVWEEGTRHTDADVAGEVRSRLRRGFLEPDPEAEGADEAQWWEPYLETAEAEGSTPMLAGELFAALGAAHARAALPLVEGEARVAELRGALEEAVRTPSEFVWGRALHDDFRERLRKAAGSSEDVLPEGWPDLG